MLVKLGKLDAASEVLDRSNLQIDEVVRTNVPWTGALLAWSLRAIALGRTDDAAALYDALRPVAGHFASNPAGLPVGAVDWALGNVVSALDLRDRVDEHFEAAQAVHRRLDSPTFLADGWLDWGRAKLAAGNNSHAFGLLEEARDLSATHGLAANLRLATESLAQLS